jgi:hypothetical protein
MNGRGSAFERIRRLVGDQVREMAAGRSYLRVVGEARAGSERFADLSAEVSVVIYGIVSRLAALIGEGIAAGDLAQGEPEIIAASYLAYLNGIGLVVANAEDDPVWERLID